MFNFFIDYNNFWNNLLPDNKRLERFKSWGISLMKPLNWLMDVFTIKYLNEGFVGFFGNIDYFVGDLVIGYDNAVYRCIQDSSNTSDPTILNNTAYFIKQYDNFVAVLQRLNYNSSIGVLEWMLNTEMNYVNGTTSLINPPFQNTLNSSSLPSIYVETNPLETGMFLVGIDFVDTSNVGLYSSETEFYVGLGSAISYNFNSFTVYYDSALLSNPYMLANKYENKIKRIVDKVNLAGLKYDIQPY